MNKQEAKVKVGMEPTRKCRICDDQAVRDCYCHNCHRVIETSRCMRVISELAQANSLACIINSVAVIVGNRIRESDASIPSVIADPLSNNDIRTNVELRHLLRIMQDAQSQCAINGF